MNKENYVLFFLIIIKCNIHSHKYKAGGSGFKRGGGGEMILLFEENCEINMSFMPNNIATFKS